MFKRLSSAKGSHGLTIEKPEGQVVQREAPRFQVSILQRLQIQGRTTCKVCRPVWTSLKSRVERGFSTSQPDQSAGARVGVPFLFQLMSVVSLARMGNQSRCPLQLHGDLKPKVIYESKVCTRFDIGFAVNSAPRSKRAMEQKGGKVRRKVLLNKGLRTSTAHDTAVAKRTARLIGRKRFWGGIVQGP